MRRELMTGYLLGELSEAEQCRVEETFFTDPAFLGDLLATRDDLIDAFVREELEATESERFERRLQSSPALLEKVAFARGLLLAVNSLSPPRVETVVSDAAGQAGSRRDRRGWSDYGRMWPQMCSLLAVSLLITAGFYRSMTPARLPSSAPGSADRIASSSPPVTERPDQKFALDAGQPDAGQPDAGQPDARQQDAGRMNNTPPLPVAAAPRTNRPVRGSAFIAGFLLSPGMSRAGVELRQLTISGEAKTVRLQLEIEDDAPRRYRAVLRTRGGQEIWVRDRMLPVRVHSSRVVVCDLPSSLLQNTNYVLRLHPQPEEDASDLVYYFSVAKP